MLHCMYRDLVTEGAGRVHSPAAVEHCNNCNNWGLEWGSLACPVLPGLARGSSRLLVPLPSLCPSKRNSKVQKKKGIKGKKKRELKFIGLGEAGRHLLPNHRQIQNNTHTHSPFLSLLLLSRSHFTFPPSYHRHFSLTSFSRLLYASNANSTSTHPSWFPIRALHPPLSRGVPPIACLSRVSLANQLHTSRPPKPSRTI